MKTIFGIICAICLFSSFSHATIYNPEAFAKSAKLLTWNFDSDSFLSGQRIRGIRGGTVKVNVLTREVSIRFDLRNNCPPNIFCMAHIPSYEIKLPLKKFFKIDDCGVVTYTAERNMLSADGAHEKLIVKDVDRSICEGVYDAPTLITYTSAHFDHLSEKLVRTKSDLTAEVLE